MRVFYIDVLSPEVRRVVERNLPEGLEWFCLDSRERKEMAEKAEKADFFGVGTLPVSGELISAAGSLKLIQKFGIGVDRIDMDTARRLGTPVAITAGGNAVAVAEHAVMLMLAVLRKLSHIHEKLRQGVWLKAEIRLITHELFEKTVGLIGLGHIGKEVARRLKPFETRLIYYDTIRPRREVEEQLGVRFAPMEELLRTADLISVHVPLTPKTEKMIGRREFQVMKKDAILINTARGEVVDETALHEALADGTLGGAGLDVFAAEPPPKDSPLLRLENVVASPHSAGLTLETYSRVLRHGFDNMLKVSRGEPLPEEDVIFPGKGRTDSSKNPEIR
jgi:phosphoglycerate dehydrogenase-like enzyme